jgi:hypothetical protein
LANSAQRGVTFANLFQEPWKYRGEVIHYEGELSRLSPMGAPQFLEGEAFGIRNMYEAWIFNPEVNFDNPLCVALTELPTGLEATGKRISVPVAVDGYFFKKMRYKDAAGQLRDAPMLIGHSIQVKQVPITINSAGPFSKLLGTAFLCVLGMLVVLTVALSWWYRRGDRRIYSVLESSRSVSFEDVAPESEPSPEDQPGQPRNRLQDYSR